MKALTHDEDIDLVILSLIPDDILNILATTCTHTWKLYSNPTLWKRKIQLLHPGIPLSIDDSISYCRLYATSCDHTSFLRPLITSSYGEDIVRWHSTALPDKQDILLKSLFLYKLFDLLLLAYLSQPLRHLVLDKRTLPAILVHNRTDIVVRLIEAGFPLPSDSDVICCLSDKDRLQWAVSHLGYKLSVLTANGAACRGNVDTLAWLHEDYHILPNQRGAGMAVSNGHLAAAQWIFTNTGLIADSNDRDNAIISNHVGVVEWVYAHGVRDLIEDDTIGDAVRQDSIDTVRWLSARGYDVSGYIDDAVESEAVSVVKLLLEWGYRPSQENVDFVSEMGHLDIMEVLGSVGVYPSHGTIYKVSLPVVKWMGVNMDIKPSLFGTLIHNTLNLDDVADWLVREGEILNQKEIRDVVASGNIRAVRWLYCKYPHYKLSGRDLDEVTSSFGVEFWIFFLRLELYPDQHIVDRVVASGNMPVTRLLLDYGCYPNQTAVDMVVIPNAGRGK